LLYFILCFFWKNGNTKNQKNLSLIILKYLHNHNLYLSKSKSNHALVNPLNTLTLYSLPTLSSLCPKLEKEEDEEVPDEISRLLDILADKVKNKNQEECPERGIHLQRLARDATIIPQVHTSTGSTPLLPYDMEVVEVPVDRSSTEIQA